MFEDYSQNPVGSATGYGPATDGVNDLMITIDELNIDDAARLSLASTVFGAGGGDPNTLPRGTVDSQINITIVPNKAPKELGPVWRVKLVLNSTKTAKPQEDLGRIKTFTATGKRFPYDTQVANQYKIRYETGTDDSALFPEIEITLTERLVSSIQSNKIAVDTAYAELITSKTAVVKSNDTAVTSIDQDKLKNLNMTLVLYDEIPEYKQASGDAIVGNTYSRLVNNQFKRI